MRKDWKYIIYVGGAIILFVAVKLMSPKQFNWSISLAHEDKNPYGTYVLNELLPDIFHDKRIVNSYQTLYELKDSLSTEDNIVIFASRMSCDKEDSNALLNHVSNGGTAFISSQYFWGHLADTLNVHTYDGFFSGQGNINKSDDSVRLHFVNENLDTINSYPYKRINISHFFEEFDTTRTTIIAKNEYGQPVTIRMTWGKGNLILNSTPLAFANIYLLNNQNHEFASNSFAYLKDKNIYWTEFYHLGRMESQSPLRFILKNEPLAWAYYIVIGSILLFMIFEAKRKQRIIPIIKPLANTSLEFVSTIGNLYYNNSDHKNAAEKKINFLLEQIRSKYLLKTNDFNDEFITTLARKSGKPRENILELFRTISYIQSSTQISAGQLMDLNNKIENFYASKD